MKLVYVYGDDYAAMNYEQREDIRDFVNGALSKSESKHVVFTDFDVYLEAKLYEFGEVDKKFIDFIHENIIDYDNGKHENFFEWVENE